MKTIRPCAEPTASQEDYLEVILQLVGQTGSARVRDIAQQMNVAKPSVTVALRGLAKAGLAVYEPYQLVRLTAAGQALAERISARHKAFSEFFTNVLDVDEQVADETACCIEHAVGDGVMRRLNCFVEFMSGSKVPAQKLPQAFREYCGQHQQNAECAGCQIARKRP